MKKLLLYLPLFVFSFTLSGQAQLDTMSYQDDDGVEHLKITTYYPGGEIRSIGFYSKKKGHLTREQAFMRGVKLDGMQNQQAVLFPEKDRLPTLDSTRMYSIDGKLQERTISGPDKVVRFTYEYDEPGRLVWMIEEELNRSTPIKYIALGRLMFFDRNQIVEGRIGETVQVDIPIHIKGTGDFPLTLSSSSSQLMIVNQKTFKPERDSVLSLAIKVPADIKEEYLELKDDSGKTLRFPITIIGYDLFSHDFETSDLSEVVFPMDGRKQLVIKADESKLIRLYRDEELIDNYPTGQIRSEIDIKGFRKGQYVVEAVDFRANQKKYCKIRID